MTEANPLIKFHTDDGSVRCALIVKVGLKYTSLVWADDRTPGLRVNKVPHDHLRNAPPLLYKGKPYPLTRAKKLLRKMGRTFGITKSAKIALRD
jgi:hypothetical protein